MHVPAAAFTTEANGVEFDGALNLGPFPMSFIATWQDTGYAF